MTFAVHTPYDRGEVVDLGRHLFRKQLLRFGELDYNGKRLRFDPQLATELAQSFRAGAFDQVPVMLADANNGHTLAVERFGGEVKGLEPTSEGLDAIVELTDRGAEIVRDNPKLAVSARIINGLEQMHGKFGSAVQHVLATLDPKVTQMRPWEAVNLSNPSDVEVIDLTTQESTMPEIPVTDEQRAAFDAYVNELAQLQTPSDESDEADGGGDKGGDELTPEEVAALDAELERTLSAISDDDKEPASLSAEDRNAVELARSQAEEAQNEAATVRREMTLAKANQEIAELRAAGVPPVALDLARPFLVMGQERQPVTVDLSAFRDDDGASLGTVDLAATVRKLLSLIPRLDLSHESLPAPDGPEASFRSSIHAQLDERFGPTRRAARS